MSETANHGHNGHNGHPQPGASVVRTPAMISRDSYSSRLLPVRVPDAEIPPGAMGRGTLSNVNADTIFNALRRRWFVGLVVGLTLGAVAAYAAWRMIPAPYTAHSEVRIRTRVLKLPLPSADRDPDFKVLKQTQMQFVKSPAVLDAALRAKGIAQLGLLRAHDDDRHWLEEKLQVNSHGTEFFRISLSGENPKELAALVNAITDAYKVVVVDQDRKAVDERLKILRRLHADALDELEAKRRTFRVEAQTDASNAKQADQKHKSLLERRNDLERRLTDVQIKLMNHRIIEEALKKPATNKAKKETKEQKELEDHELDGYLAKISEFQTLKSRVTTLTSHLAWQKERLSENHPAIGETAEHLKKATAELEAYREKMKPTVAQQMLRATKPGARLPVAQSEQQVAILNAQQKQLQARLDEVKDLQRKAGVSSVFIEARGKELERQEKFTSSLANEVERIKAELVLRDRQPRIEVQQRAEVPRHPDYKLKYTGTALAGLGVFSLILAGAVFIDIRSRRISTMHQVSHRVGVPVIGALPLIPRVSMRSSGSNGWNPRTRRWYGMLRESVDAMRTVLLREAEQGSLQVLLVSSAMRNEGKTTVCSHLASSLARAGRRVLLIDGDMRRSSLHRIFDIPQSPGLAELLRGDVQPDEALLPSSLFGLTVLPAGGIDSKTLEVLSQNRLGELLQQWRSRFDFIIIDSAPILPVTDSLLMARQVDGVLLSVRRDVSQATKVAAACDRLDMLGVPPFGAVAVGLDDESHRQRYPSDYHYGTDPYEALTPAAS